MQCKPAVLFSRSYLRKQTVVLKCRTINKAEQIRCDKVIIIRINSMQTNHFISYKYQILLHLRWKCLANTLHANNFWHLDRKPKRSIFREL